MNRVLPELKVGDYLVIHDAGGYTHSMYSAYNSRPAPPVYGHDDDTDRIDKEGLAVLRRGCTIEESLALW